jgi:hypothetical protein
VTLIAMLFVPLAWCSGGRARIVRGAIEVHGGLVDTFLRRGTPFVKSAAAMTLGHVILGRNLECLETTRDHEHVHVRQYERWGPIFLPAYLGASAVLWLRGYDPYFDNPFEREAYRTVG